MSSRFTRAFAASLLVLAPCMAQQDSNNEPDRPEPQQQQQQPDQRGGWRRAGESRDNERPRDVASQPPPASIVVPAGTWITIRVNEPLSSDRNQPGDSFTATLVQPIIADGYVVARRGQTVGGRVAEAVKAGRSKGTSRLAIELTELSLVDGQQKPVLSQLTEYNGGTSVGRDATAIGVTTGTGAAIGAAAAGGVGAGAGAAAGAVASAIGVLLTRGRATVIYPEATLTFRTQAPITINTERAAHAYQEVRQEDYEPRLQRRTAQSAQMAQPAPYYWGGFGWPYYSPYYYGWGPSFYYFSGPRFYGGGFGRVGGGHFGGGGRGRR